MTVPCDDDGWEVALTAVCEAQEQEGFALVTMATRSAAVEGPGGMAAPRYETQLVLVFQHRRRPA
jgi:hypothetical protein